MYKKDTINKGVEGSTDFLACQLILSSTDVNTVMPERKKKEKYGNEQEKEKRERENTNPLIHQPIEMGQKRGKLQLHPTDTSIST